MIPNVLVLVDPGENVLGGANSPYVIDRDYSHVVFNSEALLNVSSLRTHRAWYVFLPKQSRIYHIQSSQVNRDNNLELQLGSSFVVNSERIPTVSTNRWYYYRGLDKFGFVQVAPGVLTPHYGDSAENKDRG